MTDLARIKNNVARMVSMGAPESDIDGYIASEGVTIEDVRNYNNIQIKPLTEKQKAKPKDTDYLGIVKAGLEGFGEGIEGGVNRAINTASFGAYDWLNRKFLGDQYGKQQRELEQRAESAGVGGLNTLANLLTDIGAGGATTGNVAYNLAGKVGLKGLGQLIGAGALEGGAWGATGSDTLEQVATNVPVSAVTGGVVGGGLGAIGNALKRFSPKLSSVGLKTGLENALTDNNTVKALKRGALNEDIANTLLSKESEVKNALNTRSADALEALTGQRFDVASAKQANRQAYKDYFADNADKEIFSSGLGKYLENNKYFDKYNAAKNEANDLLKSFNNLEKQKVNKTSISGKTNYDIDVAKGNFNKILTDEEISKIRKIDDGLEYNKVKEIFENKYNSLEKEAEKNLRKFEKNLSEDDIFKNMHKNNELDFYEIPLKDVSGYRFYKSPSYNRRQSSSYYTQVDPQTGDVYYIRKSDHWGNFYTNYKFSDLVKNYGDEYKNFIKNNPNSFDSDFIEYINSKYGKKFDANDYYNRLDSIPHNWKLNENLAQRSKSKAGAIKVGNIYDNKTLSEVINPSTEFQKESLSKALSEANKMTNSKEGTLAHTNEVKKALNDMIDSSMTQGSNMQMKPTAKTNQLMELKSKLDDLLRQNSEIKNLDTEYSRLARLDEAYKQGFNANPRSRVNLANDEQKTAFLKGAADNILSDVKTDNDLSRAIMNKQNILNKAMGEKEYQELMSRASDTSSQYNKLRDILNRARITTGRYSNLESPANLRELGDSRLSAALYEIGKLANSIYGASNKKIAQRIIDGLPIDNKSLLLEVLARANPAATGSFINQEILGRE